MKQATICRSYMFEAPHFLPDLHPMHKYRRMHGHSYKVEIRITGDVDQTGLVRVEFGAIDLVMEPILISVDNHLWNDKIGQPTVENIAKWICMMVGKVLNVPPCHREAKRVSHG